MPAEVLTKLEQCSDCTCTNLALPSPQAATHHGADITPNLTPTLLLKDAQQQSCLSAFALSLYIDTSILKAGMVDLPS